MTKTIAADEVQWADLLEEVKTHHEEVVITQDGQPIVRLVPIPVSRPRRTLEELRNSVRFVGDVESPVDDWDVER